MNRNVMSNLKIIMRVIESKETQFSGIWVTIEQNHDFSFFRKL